MAAQVSHKQKDGLSLYREELEQVETELSSLEVCLQEMLDRQHQLTSKRSELKTIIEQNESRHELQKDLKFWNGTDFEWSNKIDSKLKSVFKLKELRPMQRQTMNATMSGKDCLLIMPTGGGKSLCFQLPAVISNGLTLVVSPLVSLMEDQQMALEQLNVPSAILTASSTKDEQKFVLDDMVKPNGSLRLLYVTPEKLAKSKRFMNKLEKCYSINHLSRLVIDEVHCCSQWGHDFRPDYKFLGIMKRQFPKTPILGLTATATTKVLEDVKKILNIPKALELKASFNRPNLFYEVREKPSAQKESIDAILSLIKGKFKNQSGIVYCFSRKESEEVTTQLSSQGVEAGCYHSDMSPKHRSSVHRKWLQGTLQVVVATIAFGMGIDKPDVRFVIHHTISKSMENLYQESGRAGRDGKRSDCIVFYRLSDVIRQSTMVFTEQTGLSNLHGIVKYCIDVSSVEKRDMTHHCADVVAILDAASSTDQRVTALKLVDAWYGKGAPGLKLKSIKPPSITKATADRILAHMLVYDYLNEDFHFTAYSTICYLVPGPKAKMVRNKVTKILMDFPLPPSASKSKTQASSSSSSSTPSSTARDSNKPSPSLSRKESSENKPKLVVINMEKSHFSSMSVPSVISSTSSSTSSSKSLSSKSSSSSSRLSSSSKKSSSSSNSQRKSSSLPSSSSSKLKSLTSSPSPKLQATDDICEAAQVLEASHEDSDEDLNFDDDDTKIFCNSNSKQKRGSTDGKPQCVSMKNKYYFVANDDKDSDDDCDKQGKGFESDVQSEDGKGKNKRKRKRIIVSSDDDENEENDDVDLNSEEISSSHNSPKKRIGSSLSLNKRRIREDESNSIIVSDDEKDSDDE